MLLRYVQKYDSSYIFSEFKRWFCFSSSTLDLEKNSTMISRVSSTICASLLPIIFPPGFPWNPSTPVSCSHDIVFNKHTPLNPNSHRASSEPSQWAPSFPPSCYRTASAPSPWQQASQERLEWAL